MVELDHPFTMSKPVDENWQTILDLERLVPCVDGGRVTERTGPDSVKAHIKVKMGAMSLDFAGTVTVKEKDESNHLAVMEAQSCEIGGQGCDYETVPITLEDC